MTAPSGTTYEGCGDGPVSHLPSSLGPSGCQPDLRHAFIPLSALRAASRKCRPGRVFVAPRAVHTWLLPAANTARSVISPGQDLAGTAHSASTSMVRCEMQSSHPFRSRWQPARNQAGDIAFFLLD